MINPNGGDQFAKHDPLAGATKPSEPQTLPGATSRYESTSEKVSAAASDAWRQTREKAGVARERTEFFLRENPVPTVLGALALGVAIGLAIRYSSESKREVEVKSSLGNLDLGALGLASILPLLKGARHRYEDAAGVVKDRVSGGVDRLRSVDVDDYVQPLRKKWRSWMN